MFDTIGKKITWLIALLTLLGMLGYNVKASLPPTRTEVDEKVTELRELIKEANDLIVVVSQEVRVNTDDRLMQRWRFLDMKRQNEGLNTNELVEFCQISAKLGLQGQGCA